MRPTLRRELLASFAVLFAAALVMAMGGLALALPFFEGAAEAALFLLLLLFADLVVLFVFGRHLIRRMLLAPLDRIVEDTRSIAEGEYHRRIRGADTEELGVLSESVARMARRLVRNQELLAENVESLEATNRALTEARDEAVRTARLASAGTLAAGLAHEVGNPLGAIRGYVDVARARAEREGGDTELLDEIGREAERIDRIIRGLLDYARPRRGDGEPAPASEVVERVVDLLDAQGRLGGIRVEREVESPAARVEDPHRLEQVLVNLLLNAAQALAGTPDPTVTLGVREEVGRMPRLPRRREGDPPGIDYAHRRRLAGESGAAAIDPLRTADRIVVVTVADNGPGLPGEDPSAVFDPFFTTKEAGQGTGLGLAICARLVEGVGGRIEAGERPGGGALFTLRLPAAEDVGG